MRSRASFFKAVLIQKATLRFWPAWALYLAILFFVIVVPVYHPGTGDAQSLILSVLKAGYHPVLVFCFAILFALLTFSWLYSARSANMMHAFPLKRSQLFASHYIAGLGFLIIPQIIMFLAAIPGCLGWGIRPGVPGLCLLNALACDFIFYTIAVLCCMLSGHMLSALVYCLIFNSVFVIAKELFTGIQSTYGYGLLGSFDYSAGKGTFLSPVVFIAARCGIDYQTSDAVLTVAMDSVHLKSAPALIGFCIAAVGLLILSVYLYRLRQVECAGEMSAFRALNPMIRWIVGICCGVGMGFALTMILFDRGYVPSTFKQLIVLVTIFMFVWFVIAEMVLKKTFRIFRPKLWAEWAVMCAVVICLLGAMKVDAFHVVYKVPEATEVQAASVQGNYTVLITDEQEIENARRLHQTMLDNKDQYEKAQEEWNKEADLTGYSNEWTMQDVNITYFLKNGKQLKRTYVMPVTAEELQSDTGALSVLSEIETPESALVFMLGPGHENIRFANAAFEGKNLGPVDPQALYEAIKKDIEAGSVYYRTEDKLKKSMGTGLNVMYDGSLPVSMTGVVKGHYKSGYSALLDDYYLFDGSNISHAEMRYDESRGETDIYIDFWINIDCENTCALLKQCGVIDDPSDLDQMQYNNR